MASASQKTAFLPPGAGMFFKRRASELIGLALCLTAVALLLALTTYRPADPSFNTASGLPESRWPCVRVGGSFMRRQAGTASAMTSRPTIAVA